MLQHASVTPQVGPAAASLVRGPLRREGFADAGLRLVARDRNGGGWMYLAAYLVVPLLLAAGIGLSLLIGYQHLTDLVSALEQATVGRGLLRRRVPHLSQPTDLVAGVAERSATSRTTRRESLSRSLPARRLWPE